jgi:hypothetical protein
MVAFEQYVSSDRIIRELCRARVRLAERRHESLFYHNIDGSQKPAEEIVPPNWDEIHEDIFPSRKQWSRYRPKNRGQISDVTLNTLLRAVHDLGRKTPNAPWAQRLSGTVSDIRERALDNAFSFRVPKIVKEAKDQTARTYRPLASFLLSDKIIDSLTARYFRENLNSALLKSCLAFRPRTDGRHKGLDEILLKRSESSRLFVAECDIMGFFDCVSHEIARFALEDLIADARRIDKDLVVDDQAIRIFNAYLECYSFLRNIQQEAEVKLQDELPGARFPWREKELRSFYGREAVLENIGIPQGGALSGFIANAVLHRADKRIAELCPERQITYLRYCDDMVLLAPTEDACREVFTAYTASVNDLRLPIHLPKVVRSYEGPNKRQFWSTKSKAPYLWGNPREQPSSFPWMQFLGYQIRFDGAVRVRPASIEKELKKLTLEGDKLMRLLRAENASNLRRSKGSIRHRFRMKLVAMAVGRRTLSDKTFPLPKCWANGFRWLSEKRMITTNLKALDRHRERQVSRINRRLQDLNISVQPRRDDDSGALDHYGCPFSYWGQFR